MSNRKRDTTGLRTPDVIRAGQDRVVHQTTVDPIRPHGGDTGTEPAASAPHCRLAASRAALGSPAECAPQHARLGVSDQAAQPQSP